MSIGGENLTTDCCFCRMYPCCCCIATTLYGTFNNHTHCHMFDGQTVTLTFSATGWDAHQAAWVGTITLTGVTAGSYTFTGTVTVYLLCPKQTGTTGFNNNKIAAVLVVSGTLTLGMISTGCTSLIYLEETSKNCGAFDVVLGDRVTSDTLLGCCTGDATNLASISLEVVD